MNLKSKSANTIKTLLIILMLSLCSITMVSCGDEKGSLKQKDGIDANSIRINAPGKEEITFNDTGKYTIYLQTAGNSNGTYYSLSNDMGGINVKLYSKDKNIDIQSPKASSTMTTGTDTYEGIFTFEIEKPGTYTLESNLNNTKIQNVGIKIEKSNAILVFILKIFLGIILSISLVFSIVAAVFFFIIRKKKNKRSV